MKDFKEIKETAETQRTKVLIQKAIRATLSVAKSNNSNKNNTTCCYCFNMDINEGFQGNHGNKQRYKEQRLQFKK